MSRVPTGRGLAGGAGGDPQSDRSEALNLSTDLAGRVLVGPHAGELITRIQNHRGEWQFARGWKHAESLAYRDGSRIRFIIGGNRGARSEADESLTRIAIDLAGADRSIDEIPGTLARVGAMTGSSRVCIFTAEDGGAGSLSNSHEWCAEGERPLIHRSQEVDASQLEPIMTRFEQKPWNFVDGTAGEDGGAHSWLDWRSTQAILSVAVFDHGILRGLTCYEGIDRDHGEVVEDLRLIAILLMQAIGEAKIERELRKTDELFQLLRNSTGDVVFDSDLSFVGAGAPSDGAGSNLDDWDGKRRFTGEEWFSIIHPEDVESVRRAVEAIFADRERNSFSIEYRARRRDGSYIHLLDRGEVIRDDAGNPIRVIGLSTDVSERVIAWQRLRESDRRFRAVIENVSEVILVLNGDGFVEYASPSSRPVLGYEPSIIEGSSIFDNVHTEDAERLRAILSREAECGDISSMATFRYRHTLGNWILLESTATTLRRDAQMQGSVLVCRDVTERRRAERQIEQSTRLTSLGHLASSLAHEFNNVLMGARPYIDVIRLTSDPGVVENAIDRIEAAIDRGRSISERIVSFAQPADTVVEAIALGPWIRSVEKELRDLLPPTVALDLQGPEEGIYVSADPVGLQQVLVNVIINARDATGGRGRITIEWNGASERRKYSRLALVPADHAVIEIHDTGSNHSRLPDQPIDWSAGMEQSAPALGLTVVRQLLSAQGGSIEIDRSDRGTSYFLILRTAQSARTAEAGSIAENETGRRILLVEDDEVVASGISAVLQLEGQQVEAVSTGKAAIEHIREYGVPDVVILDIGLPDISGVEVFGRLRTRHPHLPVIFSSGHGRRKELEPLLAQPEVAFLQKPYDARTLMETVERIVGVG
ncbi:MAG: PAS domain S-box protein [Acidobacteria bacterium]|nr:PAS domain S-box protein [Acidobacteriota bacterium]